VAVIGAGGIGVDVAHWLTHSEENLVQSKTSMIGRDLGRTSGWTRSAPSSRAHDWPPTPDPSAPIR
jgi:hypothetical protein